MGMKFFLSSIRLPNQAEQTQLFESKPTVSVAIVPNAWDTYPDDRQRAELVATTAQFKKLGFHTSILDIVTSSDKQREVSLSSNDFVWIMGGNTFYLNYCVQKAGFDKLLKTALEKGLVYGGTSAGAVIAGPTLHGVENIDDPKEAPQVIWDGLGFVDFGIVPHWGMEKYTSELGKMKQEMQPHIAQIVTLTNEQAITVIDGKQTIR